MTKVKTPRKTAAAPKTSTVSIESALARLNISQGRSERRQAFPHILASPVHYEPNYAYPLLVWLHESGQTEREVFDVVPKISSQNYVAVAPRGLSGVRRRVVRSRMNGQIVDEKAWTEPNYVWPETEFGVSEAEDLVFESIEEAVGKFNVNRRRIFLLGRGDGGTMALRVGLRNPREFAGVVAIDSAFPSLEYLPLRSWRAARDLPILMTTGSASSSTVPSLTAEQLKLFHTAGLTVVIRQYNDQNASAQSKQTRMKKILSDVNVWTMERALNPQTPIAELFGK